MLLRSPLRRLRVLGFIEGATLLCLIAIAVPLKHFAGRPEYVSLLGPIHGAVFTLYLLTLWGTVSDGGWRRDEVLRTALMSLLPFGTFFNDALLRRKQLEFFQRR